VRKLAYYRVTFSGNRPFWKVDTPKGWTGRKAVYFSSRVKAERFFKACKQELGRTKKVNFLSSPRLLIDAIEAFRMLESISGKSKLRKAAALYRFCHETCEEKIIGETKPYTEPESRIVELHPNLFRGVRRLAKQRGVSLPDMISGVL
jgi:hypothetical protein